MRSPHTEQGFGLIGTVVLATALLIIATSLATAVLANFRYQHRAYLGTKALHIAEAGIERGLWELNQPGSSYTGETGTAFGGGTYDVVVSDLGANIKEMTVTATVQSGTLPLTRRVRVTLSGTPSDQVAFNYGVQVGDGGLDMRNASRIIGNVYSNGNATATNNAQIVGDLYVAGPTGTISGFKGPGGDYGVKKAGTDDGDAHAHNISDTDIHGDAFYGCVGCISSSSVVGTQYPDSPDPESQPLPISDAQIDEWKADAAAGGTQTGDFVHSSNTTVSIGPRKIVGNFTVSDGIVNVTGPLHITGEVTVSNDAIIQVDASFGTNGTYLISDGSFNIRNTAIFRGSGNAQSFLLAISTTTADPAILIQNSAKNDIVYAPHSWVQIDNSNSVRQVTGYGLRVRNTATIQYDVGLASAAFSSGPGGKWTVTAWQELR